jgi:SAM-dependent methyltransferase
MAAAERFVDTLSTDSSYRAEAAQSYDAFMPPGTVFADDRVHQDVIRRSGGVALELGTGNGRFLVPALEAGLAVEGIDSSADMIEVCRGHVERRGLATTLHVGDMAPLTLERTYQAIVCPAGSFSLVTDVDIAHAALRSYREHLAPGGQLAITLFTADPSQVGSFAWRLRRTGTSQRSGNTYVVHESVGPDVAAQTILTYNRLETYDARGRQVGDAELRKLRTRWWQRDEFTAALQSAGFEQVKLLGDEAEWVALAR